MFGIDGLLYIPSFITQTQHDSLIKTIDNEAWRTDLARRTQHYGYIYDYKAKTVDPSMRLGNLPHWLVGVAERVCSDSLMAMVPDQAIINEYLPGQGIADHIDCTPCFGDVVISITLGSTAVMELKHRAKVVPILLEPCSALVLCGEARYNWTHGISKRKQDVFEGRVMERGRRVSITLRKVIVAVPELV
jgi:alkylated DNA repair dioxygenase AlkB